MLRLNGYSTGAFGKWHETAAWETSVSGPFDRWPTHQGSTSSTDSSAARPTSGIRSSTTASIKVDPPKMENYHFTVDMTNQAINWVKAQQSMTPDKPFFVYYATGATHAPHHVPKEWADKYKGQFDKGWDQVRNETLERQKKLGVIPANTAGREAEGPRRVGLAAGDQRRLFARQAEVFAGFLEQTDAEIGRFAQALADIGELDNTLFIYIAGDNGTSAEGGFVGMYNEMTYFNGVAEKVEDLIPLIDKWGGPETFPHMSAGWAVAFDTPSRGPSRWRPTSAAPATAWSSTGRRASRRTAACAVSSRTSSTSPRRSSRPPVCRTQERQRHGADADRGHEPRLRLQRCEGAGAAQDAVFRDVRQSRDLQRWLAGPDHPPRAGRRAICSR